LIVKSAIFVVLGLASDTEDLSVLRPGDAVEGAIDEADRVIRTEKLVARYKGPIRCETYRIERTEPGPYHVEVRSHLFDTYLVVRSLGGEVLFEDDDGLLNSHSRIVVSASTRDPLLVEVCALHSGTGPYRVGVVEGEPEPRTPAELRKMKVLDLRLAVDEREQVLGVDHPSTATSLSNLAGELWVQGAYPEAGSLFKRALAIRESALGPNHPATATTLNNLAVLLEGESKYAEARPLYERALAIRESTLGPNHVSTADSLSNLASLHKTQGAYAESKLLYERALAITESALGPDHAQTATSLNNLASLLKTQGVYEEAIPLYERAVSIYTSALGADHPHTAIGLSNLASSLQAQGAYTEAKPLYERALAITESAFGRNHAATATRLNNLAGLLQVQGAYREARPLFERVLAILESALGPDHPTTAASLNNLAISLKGQGSYAEARELYERALVIQESAVGPNHPDLAISLSNLAGLLEAQGAHSEAKALYERVLVITEAAFGPNHPSTAASLDTLAGAYLAQGADAEARSMYERALEIQESVIGPDHPRTAMILSNLARLLMSQGAYVEARPLCERAVAIAESTLGPDHPRTATILNGLAAVLAAQGAYADARALVERALAITESTLGPDHPSTTVTLNSLALLHFDLGELDSALSRSRAALSGGDAHVKRTLWSLSEVERIRFLAALRWQREAFVSVVRAASNPSAERAAYGAVLAGKGRAARSLLRDAGRERLSLPRGELRLVERLRGLKRQLSDTLYSTKTDDPVARARRLEGLRRQRNDLEVELSRLRGRGEDKGSEQDARLDAVMSALPDGAAAVDFYIHRWAEPAQWYGGELITKRRWTARHLSAWVLRRGQPLRRFDLGVASDLESAVSAFLEDMVSRRGVPAAIVAGAPRTTEQNDRLRTLLWGSLAEAIGDARIVIVSGDGFLGGLPFETLQREDGSYLIEHHTFSYLADLARLPNAVAEKEWSEPRLLAAGDIEYWQAADVEGTGDALTYADARGALSRIWPALDWTGREVSAIAGMHRRKGGRDGVQLVLKGEDAIEERVKEAVSGFTHIHLATHGYFHPEGIPSAWKNLRKRKGDLDVMQLRETEQRLVGSLPGLLSGLVFAGANAEPEPGRDNGLLTAEEITYLDLSDCDLVVLSACETGLGRPESGEGMIGLRRAFRMAGARTVISSLWEVSDKSTRDLMTLFYENLWLKEMPKLEALRQAQLTLLQHNRETRGHGVPSTWGAFVLDGAPK